MNRRFTLSTSDEPTVRFDTYLSPQGDFILCANSYRILRIGVIDGAIHRYDHLPDSVGLQLDEEKRVLLGFTDSDHRVP